MQVEYGNKKITTIQDCPSTVMSSSFTNLPSEAEPEFLELSLGVKAPVTTSSFIDHLRLLKRKRPSQHQELVNAAKSFTLQLLPSDSAPVTTSNLFINYSAIPISFIPPKKTTYPTCRGILKKPVHKKKRTNKAKCGQMDANKLFQIICWDALATQPIEEPQNKKRNITPKIKYGLVVKNEVTERLQKFITGDEMNGLEPKLVI
nr:hypothetical protein [Tanacetum cinerariifolium]